MGDYIKTGSILLAFALAIGILLAGVYLITKDSIAQADLNTKLIAIKSVLTDSQSGSMLIADSQIPKNVTELQKIEWKKGETDTLFTSSRWKGTVYSPVYLLTLKDGRTAYVASGSGIGYGGNVKIMASFIQQGTELSLLRMEVLDFSQETPGLGTKISETAVKQRFFDIPATALNQGITVDKDANVGILRTSTQISDAKSQGIIYTSDIMTGATITPRAAANAINTMVEYLNKERGR